VTVWATALFVSFPLGPIVGGLLLNNFWWGSVFLINVPVVLVALVAIQWLMPESRSPHRVRFEPVALLLAIGSLVAVTYGVIEVGDRGWGDRRSWAWLLLAAVLLIAFLGRQRRQQARVIDGESLLIDLRIFRSAGYTWGIVLAVAATFAMFGLLFAGPQYFQSVLGYDALGTGLRQLPMIGGLVVGGRLAGPVLARTGARVAVGIGFALMTIALLLGATTSISSGFAVSALWMAIFGFGIGFSLPTAMGAAISAIPPERSGMGSGLLMSLRMAAGAIGVAVLGSVVNSGYRGHLQLEGLPGTAAQAVRDGVGPGVRVANALGDPGLLRGVESAFIHGMDLMYVVSAGICLIGGALGLAFLPDRSDGPDRPDRADHGEPVGLPDPGDGESEHDVARTR
jgi:DHA2 family multidrug resistance protein-like MFS transporter